MKPYYEDAFITIYHGDCKAILPGLVGVRSIVSDPPYGMNYKPKGGILSNGGLKGGAVKHRFSIPVIGDKKPFCPKHLLHYDVVILFGGHHFSDKLPQSRGWLFWDKKPQGYPKNQFSDGDLIWTNQNKPIRTFKYLWQGALRQGGQNTPHLHPTEKPVALMKWIFEQIAVLPLVCDPYCGSGPTLIAAKQLGLQAIGIELVEEYCEIAAKRCAGTSPMFPALRATNKANKAELESGAAPEAMEQTKALGGFRRQRRKKKNAR